MGVRRGRWKVHRTAKDDGVGKRRELGNELWGMGRVMISIGRRLVALEKGFERLLIVSHETLPHPNLHILHHNSECNRTVPTTQSKRRERR